MALFYLAIITPHYPVILYMLSLKTGISTKKNNVVNNKESFRIKCYLHIFNLNESKTKESLKMYFNIKYKSSKL